MAIPHRDAFASQYTHPGRRLNLPLRPGQLHRLASIQSVQTLSPWERRTYPHKQQKTYRLLCTVGCLCLAMAIPHRRGICFAASPSRSASEPTTKAGPTSSSFFEQRFRHSPTKGEGDVPTQTTKNLPSHTYGRLFVLGDVLLSQDPAVQVPSALEGLTVVFGMGTRGSPPPSSPNVAFAR